MMKMMLMMTRVMMLIILDILVGFQKMTVEPRIYLLKMDFEGLLNEVRKRKRTDGSGVAANEDGQRVMIQIIWMSPIEVMLCMMKKVILSSRRTKNYIFTR